jgi:hypothetical protein
LEGRPSGPLRILEGDEYDAARKLANKTNQAIRRANPEYFKGLEIHEIQPIKFGGSPTDINNKIFLDPQNHYEFSIFWDNLKNELRK